MLRSLFRPFLARLRAARHARRAAIRRPPAPRSSPPALEPLEDRCLLSATTVPAPVGTFPFIGLQDAFMAAQPKVDAPIVFLGDSITYGFAYGTGAPIWAAMMVRAGATDYGVVGQTTQSLLFQLALGQLNGVHNSVIVLTIGTNNLLMGDSPADTAAGILADVNTIHLIEPAAQVLVLGVPPGAPNPSDGFRSAVRETDELVRQELAGDPRATFFDIAPAFVGANGMISNQTLSDYIHPTFLGYANMALALMQPLAEAYAASNANNPHPTPPGTVPPGIMPPGFHRIL